jgi:hypothetical protein
MEQKAVLSEKTGKKHAVPVFVGDRLLEMVDGLGPTLCVALVAQLSTVCAELVSQRALIGRQGGVRFMTTDGQALQRLFSASFRNSTCAILAGYRLLELATEISGEARHGY